MMKPFALGDLVVDRVEESGGLAFPSNAFLVGLPEAAVDCHADLLDPHHYDAQSRSGLSTIQSWIVRTPRYNVLIDTCCGNDKTGLGIPGLPAMSDWMERLAIKGLS